MRLVFFRQTYRSNEYTQHQYSNGEDVEPRPCDYGFDSTTDQYGRLCRQSYASLSQEALDKNMTRYVYLAKSEDHHLVLPVSDTPLAIYFILDHQPVSGWNYLINSPQGAVQSFTVNTSNVTRTQNIELKAKSDDSSKKKS